MTIVQAGVSFGNGSPGPVNFGLDGGRTLQLGGTSTATSASNGAIVTIDLNATNPNSGLSDAGSGTLTILSGATFNDETTTTTGLFILASPHGSGDTGSTAAVNNAGTFLPRAGSATTSTISTLFNNTSTVDVESGTLNLSGGGTDVGATYKGPGTVNFSGGTRTLDAASSITGNATFSGGADDGQRRHRHRITEGHRRNCDLRDLATQTVTTGCTDANRRRAQWLWHADGDRNGQL